MFPSTSFLSADEVSEVPDLIELLKSLQIFTYFRFVCGALLVYDYILTFSDEVNFMWKWKRRWNLFDATYYTVRYLPFFDIGLIYMEQYLPHTNTGLCEMLFSIQSTSFIVGVDLANCILTLRTYVIWNKDKRILATLGVALLASIVGEAYYLAMFLISSRFPGGPVPFVFPGCFVSQADASYAWAAYLVLLVLESVIFALTLIKYFRMQ